MRSLHGKHKPQHYSVFPHGSIDFAERIGVVTFTPTSNVYLRLEDRQYRELTIYLVGWLYHFESCNVEFSVVDPVFQGDTLGFVCLDDAIEDFFAALGPKSGPYHLLRTCSILPKLA